MNNNKKLVVPTANAIPVVIDTNINYTNNNILFKFILYKKECLKYNHECYLFKKQNFWILTYAHKNTTRYKIDIQNKMKLYDLIINLGINDGKYKIIILNQNDRQLKTAKFNNLKDSIDWCFETNKDLNLVSIDS